MSSWIDEALRAGTLFFNAKGKPVSLEPPAAPVADTHAHLSMAADAEASAVERRDAAASWLARAWFAGVTWVVCIVDASEAGRDAKAFLSWLSETEEAAQREIDVALSVGLVPAFPREPLRVDLSAGVHPYGAAELEGCVDSLKTLLADPRCVALGECGLDYHSELPHGIQRAAFARQLELAREFGLPLELHVRDEVGDAAYEAHEEALEIVAAADVAPLGIDLHCYTLGPEPLEGWLAIGSKVAFGGAMTFKRSDEIRDAAAACPLDALLTETDSPYMSPEPLRGRAAEPAFTLATADLLAEVRGEALGEPRRATFEAAWGNARELFGSSRGRR